MLVLGDLGLFGCSNPTVNPSTTGVGGGVSGTQITGSTIGEIFPSMTPPAFGGSAITIYNKVFAVNGSSTDNAVACSFWFDNLLTILSGPNTISFFSTSANDGSSLKLRVLGFDQLGNPSLVETAFNGTSLVTTSAEFDSYSRMEVRTVASPYTLTATQGLVTIQYGTTTVGYIPLGAYSATSELTMGVVPSLNDTTTISTATTPPAPTMYAPNSSSSALASSGTQTITPMEGQGLWWGLTIAAGAKMSQDCQMIFHWRANATG